MLLRRYLNYPSFCVLALVLGGLISATWKGSDNRVVLWNDFAGGVGATLALLAFGSIGRRFSRDKLSGHMIGTLVVAPLALFTPDYSKTLTTAGDVSAFASPVAKLGKVRDANAGFAAYKAGDYATALSEWTPLAVQGNAWAQHDLGLIYANGQGVPQNDAEAVKWFRLAADQGFADAQYNLGFMYLKGQAVSQDDAEAVKWFRLAA